MPQGFAGSRPAWTLPLGRGDFMATTETRHSRLGLVAAGGVCTYDADLRRPARALTAAQV